MDLPVFVEIMFSYRTTFCLSIVSHSYILLGAGVVDVRRPAISRPIRGEDQGARE